MDQKRAANFSSEETYLLIALVEKYKDILECKKSDATTWKQKEQAWKMLEEKFNASCTTNGTRSVKVLKEKYRNLKKKTKEKFSQNKVEMTKTGGGKYTPPIITDVEEAIKSIIGEQQISGLANSYDCDATSKTLVEEFNNEGCTPSQYIDISSNNDFVDQDYTIQDEVVVENLVESEKQVHNIDSALNTDKSKWCSYSAKDLKMPVTKKLRGTPKGLTEKPRTMKVTKKFVSVNTQLINEKLDFVRLQKEKFMEEHNLKMQILKFKKQVLQKKLVKVGVRAGTRVKGAPGQD